MITDLKIDFKGLAIIVLPKNPIKIKTNIIDNMPKPGTLMSNSLTNNC